MVCEWHCCKKVCRRKPWLCCYKTKGGKESIRFLDIVLLINSWMEKNTVCAEVLPNCTSNTTNMHGPSTTKYASVGKWDTKILGIDFSINAKTATHNDIRSHYFPCDSSYFNCKKWKASYDWRDISAALAAGSHKNMLMLCLVKTTAKYVEQFFCLVIMLSDTSNQLQKTSWNNS